MARAGRKANHDEEFNAVFDAAEMDALRGSIGPIFRDNSFYPKVEYTAPDAERARVAAIIARDSTAPVRVDETARRRRHGETRAEHKRRLAEIKSLEKPIGAAIITPECEQRGDYVDTFVTHVETNTKTQTKRNRMVSSLAVMAEKGQITNEQYCAALEIAAAAEIYEKAGRIKGQEIRERVDGGGAGVGPLLENLGRVRIERAYTKWRERLPMPKRMVIDMLVQDQALFATARAYGMGWPKARARLIDALDRWESVRDWARERVDQRDLDWAKLRIEG